MFVVISGCGRIGSYLANILSKEGHDIVIIDQNKKAFRNLSRDFSGSKVVGDSTNPNDLEKASIEKADALIAATGEDNPNIITCQVGKIIYNVEKTVARINRPEHEKSFSQLDIDTKVARSSQIATQLKNAIYKENINTRITLGNGDIEIIELKPKKETKGKELKEIDLPDESIICGIETEGKAIQPDKNYELKEDDRIILSINTKLIKKGSEFLNQFE